GTNLVADQLCQVDDGVMRPYNLFGYVGFPMNTLNALFDLNPWATYMGGTQIFKWNTNTFDGDVDVGGNGPPYWNYGGDMTMLPGTSVFMYNPTSAYSIWFTGLVRNQQVFSIQGG